MPSDVQVFVRFTEPCVFAGEEVSCTITFRNVADLREAPPSSLAPPWQARKGSTGQLTTNSRFQGHRGSQNPRLLSARGPGQNGNGGRHKATMSLSIPSEFNPSFPPSRSESPRQPQVPISKLQRSSSILSATSPGPGGSPSEEVPPRPARPRHGGHTRSSTVQITPGNVSFTKSNSASATSNQRQTLLRQGSGGAAGSGIGIGMVAPNHRDGSRSPLYSVTPPNNSTDQGRRPTPEFKFPSQATPDDPRSIAGSERSSAEFHSLSNHSQETLTSEQASLASERPQLGNSRIRNHYHMEVGQSKRPTVANLLMGYAQVNATFTLDGSLIDQSSFEEVKRKGFLGGQGGGGVVGMRKARAKTGFLGAFGLNTIGESLGGIIGGSDMSSVKEMKAIANARAIPLLSTPQSLLFVDLRLAPGDEKSFKFSYKLPRGLPSSHRGKAIKINYNLIVGVQGAPGDRDIQAVRQVNVPLRVFSGVNKDGEIFGHDLMQPHVILRDLAHVTPTDIGEETALRRPTTSGSAKSAAKEFVSYVDTLLDKNRRRQSSSGTIDAMTAAFNTKSLENPARQAIDRAILFSNRITSGENSPNRFEIAREGLKVAVIILDRPLHRLGETVTAIIDFSESQMLCSSIRATLETVERVSGSLAIRSTTSISRVSRKIYATHSENTLFAKRVVFSPGIPETATPTFITSGVNLDWHLKFEFGVTRADAESGQETIQRSDLLEEIVKDERGRISAAIEYMDCETFEAAIPLTVYGDIVQNGKEDDDVIGLSI